MKQDEKKMIDEIVHDGDVFAIIMRDRFEQDGIHFITSDDVLLQVGYMSHNEGHEIQPHLHLPYQRTTKGTQEVLFIKRGKVQVDFYTNDKQLFETQVLNKDDWIILLSGGHGFKMLEPSVMIEVKSGPYAGGDDKIRFTTEEDGLK